MKSFEGSQQRQSRRNDGLQTGTIIRYAILSGEKPLLSSGSTIPVPLVMWWALSRTLKRIIDQEELFSGNRETFRQSFLSRDSILWWVTTSFNRRRKEYRAIFDSEEFPHLNIIELQKPKEAEEFLK